MDNNEQHASGLGTKYFSKARSAYATSRFKLRRVQKLTSRLVTSTQAFGDVMDGVADLSRIEVMDSDEDEIE